MSQKFTNTTSATVARWLEGQRSTDGSSTLGRVLTLIAVCRSEEAVSSAVHTVADVAKAHPARIIVLLADPLEEGTEANLDAEIADSADRRLSEVIILRPTGGAGSNQASLIMPLLLPDCPVITWWVDDAPVEPSTTPLGLISQRRITNVNGLADPVGRLIDMSSHHASGDTDLAWAGLTIWRGHCATLIDEPPHLEITEVEVTGNTERGGTLLLAAWLQLRLGVPAVRLAGTGTGIDKVCIRRADGDLEIDREVGADIATLRRPGREDLQVSMPMRTTEVMMIEELRTLGDDIEYGEVLTKGLATFKN